MTVFMSAIQLPNWLMKDKYSDVQITFDRGFLILDRKSVV